MRSVTPQPEEYPPRVSLQKDVYRPFPGLPAALPAPSDVDATAIVETALRSLASAIQAQDVARVKSCFLANQAYWRDLLAFTYHFRTFNDGGVIAPAISDLAKARGIAGGFHLVPGSVHDVTLSPELRWIEGIFTFETANPAARCGGRIVLLPQAVEVHQGGEEIGWGIWSLATWIDEFVHHPENVDALKAPGRKLEDDEAIESDVLIVGGGNAGIILAARLKALGVDSVVIDKNPQPGDNWDLRYDCLRFHIAKSNCETPYLPYPKELPMILTKRMLADHMKRYAAAFNLNILNSSTVEATSFRESNGTWHLRIRTPWGPKTVTCKQIVQASGIGSSKPFVPQIPGASSYKGVNIHSVQYRNPKTVSDSGAKSVIIVGSANSAFDIMEDCAQFGLQTTMVARSPTYIFPWDYALAPEGLGLYEKIPAELADNLQMSGPASIGGQLAVGLQAALASKEPDRYKALEKAGFPVYDSLNGGDLTHHLLERAGGHFNDIGDGVELIVSGKVPVKANVEPVAYTATGLRFSDGSTLDADAIVWCTGFADKDRQVTAEVLGGEKFSEDDAVGPQEIAAQRDGIWGVDAEGELRGVWKRHLRLGSYWTHGGTTAHHRYYSKPLALQIKAAVDGFLPEAYRDTPEAV